MKAARIHNYGGATAVRIDEVEVLQPNPGEVRIRVEAALTQIFAKLTSFGRIHTVSTGIEPS